MLADVEATHEHAIQAEEHGKIKIYLALQQGLTTGELAPRLNVGQQTVSRWGREGKELYEKREQSRDQRNSPDPLGPDE